ncbi:putative quinol monooxygenase [Xylanibacter oryzae]|jgi:quinol monooxygenase YgiN|uniref:putative quinol monooxygenase n=1 Tax=Xylanibacter oryzae TaxID=185293 RepID=UPI0004BB003B|nr:putative quinol monooxygenase [Xylanibacter oryzae]
MIRLNVFIKTTSAKRTEVIETAKELVTASLNDKGNIAYDIFESDTRNDVLMICETWEDAESLLAHEQSSHFTTLVSKIKEMGKMKIEKFNF